jgi:hypothetical protein
MVHWHPVKRFRRRRYGKMLARTYKTRNEISTRIQFEQPGSDEWRKLYLRGAVCTALIDKLLTELNHLEV